jgi:hypothetical protein
MSTILTNKIETKSGGLTLDPGAGNSITIVGSITGYATENYVTTAISNLVDSAPAALDTLNELSAALGDDANFSTTVTNSIATKWTQDNTKISNWDTAYGWGDHGVEGYATETFVGTATTNSSNWDTAYGWGDHALAGYDNQYSVSVISTNTSASKDTVYVFTASLVLTLPASPAVGDKIGISNQSGTTTATVARNGNNIQGFAEDMVIDIDGAGIELIYTGVTKGWIIL